MTDTEARPERCRVPKKGEDTVSETVLALANGIGAMSRDLESTLRRLSELVARLEPLTQSQVTAAPLMHAVPRDHLR